MSLWKWITGSRGSNAVENERHTDEGGTAFSPPEAVLAEFRFLRATALLSASHLPSFAECAARSEAAWHPEGQPPALTLLVSHRWKSARHPDPLGCQLRALQFFLRHIPEVASLLRVPPEERLRRLASIRAHGVLQAAIIVGASDTDTRNVNPWLRWAHALGTTPPAKLLEQVGLWIDYSCLPQPERSVLNAARRGLAEKLVRLPDLAAACPTIILREANDDYLNRGWCVAELAAGCTNTHHLVLRTDLLGLPTCDGDFPEKADGNVFEAAGIFRSALDRWESRDTTNLSLWNLYVGLPDIRAREETRACPLVTTPRPPLVFPQHKDFLLYFIQLQGQLSALDQRDGALQQSFDLRRAILEAMHLVGLQCTHEDDVVFVGLCILRSRHNPGLVPSLANFYQTALARLLRGESLRLTGYRERNNSGYREAWFLFEGELPTARRRPRWA